MSVLMIIKQSHKQQSWLRKVITTYKGQEMRPRCLKIQAKKSHRRVSNALIMSNLRKMQGLLDCTVKWIISFDNNKVSRILQPDSLNLLWCCNIKNWSMRARFVPILYNVCNRVRGHLFSGTADPPSWAVEWVCLWSNFSLKYCVSMPSCIVTNSSGYF